MKDPLAGFLPPQYTRRDFYALKVECLQMFSEGFNLRRKLDDTQALAESLRLRVAQEAHALGLRNEIFEMPVGCSDEKKENILAAELERARSRLAELET